jgi:uncharacterized LabA/DUF88 family protein
VIEAIRDDLGAGRIVQFCNMYLAMGLPDDTSLVDKNIVYQTYARGTEPILVPSFKGNGSDRIKNIADCSAMVDIVESIFMHPEVEGYCIATGDKDYVPVVRKLRKCGKAVRIYYRGQCASVLAAEIEWIRGDGFSSIIDLESFSRFAENHVGRGTLQVGSTA